MPKRRSREAGPGPMGADGDWFGGPGRPGPNRRRGHGHGGGGGGGRKRGRRPRVSRGDVRLGVLALLQTEPMHGYQIMQELEDRSGGSWQPSPGSIYPTLQQLADEGLLRSEPTDGKNVFHLTEDGYEVAASNQEAPPWERFGGEGEATFANLRRSVFQVGAAARQIASDGSPAQAEAASQILSDAKKSLYRLLAEDED